MMKIKRDWGKWFCPSLLFLCQFITGLAIAQERAKPLQVGDVPLFQWRVRVLSENATATATATATTSYRHRLSPDRKNYMTQPGRWTEWVPYTTELVVAGMKAYPNITMKQFPYVIKLQTAGIKHDSLQAATTVEAQLQFNEDQSVHSLRGELFGPLLGVMIWRDEAGKPRAATMAQYNQRYWRDLNGLNIRAEERLKYFPITDRFIGGDDDRLNWSAGIANLAKAGFTALSVPAGKVYRELLQQNGVPRTALSVYSPPGGVLEYAKKNAARPDQVQSLEEWAKGFAKPYYDAGFAPRDIATFKLSDEPGWYYPVVFNALRAEPAALERFRNYLQEQKLSPQDVGATAWTEVYPLGRSAAKDLPSRRLFYWTMRFFAWDSSRYYAESTRALEKAFYPGLPITTNWNFFSGRLYVPGPVANNHDKTNPDAAMGGHDWLEFGRMRGGTMMWTEDWFSDASAYQWSFYASKLSSAARKSNGTWGGFVIPRTSGDREDGLLQKVLSIVGGGGKAVSYFVFGPEYNFPSNTYSERPGILPRMAKAHRMIGRAEEWLWPGVRPKASVAILHPRSAEMWDLKDEPLPKSIRDATNSAQNRATVDYMAEVFDLYLALQHSNIPVDFVEEDDLSPEGLRDYKVLYVTEPNIPDENLRGLESWLQGGGTIVTVSGAATRDRYDEPSTITKKWFGGSIAKRDRLYVPSITDLSVVATLSSGGEKIEAIGARDTVGALPADVKVEARFDNNDPALLSRGAGRGRHYHFTWLPGMSYWRSATETRDRLPIGFSPALRTLIARPVADAGVTPPVTVDQAMVEAPVLLSEKGAAITLLNWRGQKVDKLKARLHLPFEVRRIESLQHGNISFQKAVGGVTFSVPLESADVLMVQR